MFENVNLSNVGKDGKTYKIFDDGFIMANIQLSNNLEIQFVTGFPFTIEFFPKICYTVIVLNSKGEK